MNEGKSRGLSERVSDLILVAVCLCVALIVAYPLYYVVVASVSNPYDVYAGKTFLFPSEFTLDGYFAVFEDKNILSGLLNSIKYTIIGVSGGLSAEPGKYARQKVFEHLFCHHHVLWRRLDSHLLGGEKYRLDG